MFASFSEIQSPEELEKWGMLGQRADGRIRGKPGKMEGNRKGKRKKERKCGRSVAFSWKKDQKKGGGKGRRNENAVGGWGVVM